MSPAVNNNHNNTHNSRSGSEGIIAVAGANINNRKMLIIAATSARVSIILSSTAAPNISVTLTLACSPDFACHSPVIGLRLGLGLGLGLGLRLGLWLVKVSKTECQSCSKKYFHPNPRLFSKLYLSLPAMAGVRICFNCPNCNLKTATDEEGQFSGCVDGFGSVAEPEGGIYG